MASMWSCIRRKFGTIRKTIVPSTTTATGMKITSTIDRSTSSRRAITTPITIVIGAATAIVQAITTSICTCCTSLVIRVISDGAPNWPDLLGREVGDAVEQRAAQVAPEAHRDLAAEVHGGDRERDLDHARTPASRRRCVRM